MYRWIKTVTFEHFFIGTGKKLIDVKFKYSFAFSLENMSSRTAFLQVYKKIISWMMYVHGNINKHQEVEQDF